MAWLGFCFPNINFEKRRFYFDFSSQKKTIKFSTQNIFILLKFIPEISA